ncbi:MAG: ABC transporter permease [Candidatus Promineifilaceae bacterium]
MVAGLKELYTFRELLWIWTLREVTVRYKQSFFGVAWAVLQPLALMAAFTLVATFLRGLIETEGVPYPIYYYSALLPWTFFSNSVGNGTPSMINNLNLVVKTYFPREILPIAKVGVSFFDYLVGAVVFVILFIIYHLPLTAQVLWLPLLLVLQTILTLGICFLASAITVVFRDIRFLIPLALQIMLFITPIIYSVKMVNESIRPYYLLLNPMAVYIDSYREVLLYGRPPGAYLPIAAAISVVIFVVGYLVFKRLEVTFADII